MSYSSKDLENFGKGLNTCREEEARQQGQQLADDLIDSTSKGRGLWFIILWPTWVFITLLVGLFFSEVLEQKFSIEEPMYFLGFLAGIIAASSWYDWEFTREHPFFSSIIGWIFWAGAVVFLSNYLEIKI